MEQTFTWRHMVLAQAIAFVLSSSAWATPYGFTIIRVPGAGVNDARGINDAGQVVGSFNGPVNTQGYLKSGDVFTDLLGMNIAALANGINDAGQIVGSFFDTHALSHGFLLGGGFLPIEVPGASWSSANGINDIGQIVGQFDEHGFLRNLDGTFITLDVPGARFTRPQGINNAGQIVGWFEDFADHEHGFQYDGGVFTPIDSASRLRGINNVGQMVGRFVGGAILREADGGLMTLDVPGADRTEALGINDAGQIVGGFEIHFPNGFNQRGFVASPLTTPMMEPASLLLLSSGLVGLIILRLRSASRGGRETG